MSSKVKELNKASSLHLLVEIQKINQMLVEQLDHSVQDISGAAVVASVGLTPDRIDALRKQAMLRFYARPTYALRKIPWLLRPATGVAMARHVGAALRAWSQERVNPSGGSAPA